MCKSPLIGPTNQACGGDGKVEGDGPRGERGETLLHKHGAQSAGIALHSEGASTGLYRGSLF